ncbi:MAG: hypothetical protein ACLUIQ_02260 [Dialister invisus]
MCVPDEAGEFLLSMQPMMKMRIGLSWIYAENLITGMKRIKCCCRCFPHVPRCVRRGPFE